MTGTHVHDGAPNNDMILMEDVMVSVSQQQDSVNVCECFVTSMYPNKNPIDLHHVSKTCRKG